LIDLKVENDMKKSNKIDVTVSWEEGNGVNAQEIADCLNKIYFLGWFEVTEIKHNKDENEKM
tara:strand:+ start:1602 stop:1787 length:186 start_codon:yes stop_codon:yes gene_type:complete